MRFLEISNEFQRAGIENSKAGVENSKAGVENSKAGVENSRTNEDNEVDISEVQVRKVGCWEGDREEGGEEG